MGLSLSLLPCHFCGKHYDLVSSSVAVLDCRELVHGTVFVFVAMPLLWQAILSTSRSCHTLPFSSTQPLACVEKIKLSADSCETRI